MANTWFTADQHFGHKNVLKLSNRPYSSVEQMDEDIIDQYNNLVKNEDTVYFLGDFAFNQSYENYKRLFKILKGQKYFILGNHDNKQNLIRCQKEGLIIDIRESKIINLDNTTIHLTHYPLLEWYNFYRGGIHLHGHTHCRVDDYCRSTDIGVDCWESQPVSWDEIKDYINDNCEDNIHPKYNYNK